MKNNSFVDTFKVIWESLVADSSATYDSVVLIQDAYLVGIGLVCVVVTRRHLGSLASRRTRQPGAVQDLQERLQRATRSTAAPLSATQHVSRVVTAVAKPVTPNKSHAA